MLICRPFFPSCSAGWTVTDTVDPYMTFLFAFGIDLRVELSLAATVITSVIPGCRNTVVSVTARSYQPDKLSTGPLKQLPSLSLFIHLLVDSCECELTEKVTPLPILPD